MCIIIDINALSSVFNESCQDYLEFEPVRNWIFNKKAYIVWGGTTYKNELKKCQNYFNLLIELTKATIAREVIQSMVDHEEEIVITLINSPKCDDPHIIALFRVSKCKLLVSKDSRSDQFIRNKTLYPSPQKPPSIYRTRKHTHLLCEKNIIKIQNIFV